MGFKSKYRNSGLKFNNKEDYLLLKDLDKNINETVRLVGEGEINLEDVFKDVKTIIVEELYYNARDELDGTFFNATNLLMFEDTHFTIEYIIGCKFFDKIKVIDYDDSE